MPNCHRTELEVVGGNVGDGITVTLAWLAFFPDQVHPVRSARPDLRLYAQPYFESKCIRRDQQTQAWNSMDSHLRSTASRKISEARLIYRSEVQHNLSCSIMMHVVGTYCRELEQPSPHGSCPEAVPRYFTAEILARVHMFFSAYLLRLSLRCWRILYIRGNMTGKLQCPKGFAIILQLEM